MDAAARIAAAIERDPTLAARLLAVAEPTIPATPVTTARAAYDVVRPLLAGRATEALACVALNRRMEPIGAEILTTGSDGFCIVDARQIMRWALLQGKSGAYAIILAHNHPSGDPSPSGPDLDVTKRIAAAARAVGIQLIDHVIVTDAAYASLAERGELPAYGGGGAF